MPKQNVNVINIWISEKDTTVQNKLFSRTI